MGSAAAHEATHVGELHRYVSWTGTWTDLSSKSPVLSPSARAYQTLVSSGNGVYLFGGTSSLGEQPATVFSIWSHLCVAQQCGASVAD
jgi:hypothetical protein